MNFEIHQRIIHSRDSYTNSKEFTLPAFLTWQDALVPTPREPGVRQWAASLGVAGCGPPDLGALVVPWWSHVALDVGEAAQRDLLATRVVGR